MSRHERYGTRSLVYSRWHRFYMGDAEPMIDLDAIEYCHEKTCWKTLILIETALDKGQSFKNCTVLRNLAMESGKLAICVLYRSTSGTPDTSCGCTEALISPDCDHGIDRFRIKRVWPDPQKKFGIVTPEQFRDRIREIRINHMADEHRDWGAACG